MAESDKTWQDAAATAVSNAARMVRGVKSIYINDFEPKVEESEIVSYRINAKNPFLLDT